MRALLIDGFQLSLQNGFQEVDLPLIRVWGPVAYLSRISVARPGQPRNLDRSFITANKTENKGSYRDNLFHTRDLPDGVYEACVKSAKTPNNIRRESRYFLKQGTGKLKIYRSRAQALGMMVQMTNIAVDKAQSVLQNMTKSERASVFSMYKEEVHELFPDWMQQYETERKEVAF